MPRTTKPGAKRRDKRRYIPKRRVCAFCADKNRTIDYKEPLKLRPYTTDRGKIEPHRRSGTCGRHQRALARAIKRARHLALLPYTATHMRKTGSAGFRD